MKRVLVPAWVLLVAWTAQAQSGAADHNARGVEHYGAGRWNEAIESFRQALELTPDNATVRRNLCNAYQAAADALAKKADFAAAADLLEAAIQVDPRNASPLVQLASYYLRLNMIPDATFRLEDAVELDPKNLDAHELLGDAYYRANNMASALGEWEWVHSVAPDRPGLKEKLEKAYREDSVESRFGRSASRHFQISYAPGTTRQENTRVLSLLERAYLDVGKRFGGVYPPGPVPVIIYTARSFAEATQLAEYVGAVYDGKIRVPLKDEAGKSLDEAELERRLYHEYVHVVVRFLLGDNAPWWLNEGLAEAMSRESSDMELLKRAHREGALFPLSALEGDQLGGLDADALRLAYAQSDVTVRHLLTRFGPNPLSALMTALAEGTDIETALEQCYRRNYALLEREVAHQIGKAK